MERLQTSPGGKYAILFRQLEEIAADAERPPAVSAPDPELKARFVQRWIETHPGASPEEAEREFESARTS
jgi:hypothetical protein